MSSRGLTLIALLLSLSACAIKPDPARPLTDVPAQFRQTPNDTQSVVEAGWWRQFGDPVLVAHIDTALARNLDLRTAVAVLSEYRALYESATGAALPGLSLATSVQRGRALGVTATQLQATVNASWEVDFWGRLRNNTAAARADFLAQEESRQALEMVVVSTVASNYIDLLALDERLAIAQRTLAGRERTLHLAQTRFKAGVVSRIDEKQAESEYQAVVLQVRQLEQAQVQQENALSLLLGQSPRSIERGRTLEALVSPPIPAGLPSSLLTRRPDLRQAELALAAAGTRVAVARASLYPTISLTGSLGGASSQLSGLFDGPARTWAFGPSLTLPLFDGGQAAAQVAASRARLEQAQLGYEKAVQSAFRDTEDALIAVQKTREQQAAQAAQVAALRRYEQLARRRYETGITSSLELLDAQRALLASEIGLAQTRSASLQAVVALYKALGGDWGLPAQASPRAP